MKEIQEIPIKKMKGIQEVPIGKISENPYQTRADMDEEALKLLAKSIRERGLFNPISVLKEKDKFIVINGHRRLAAFKLLRRKTIPAFVKDKQKDKTLIIDLIHENLLREDLNPVEKANSIYLLLSTIKNVKSTDLAITLINLLRLYKKRGMPEHSRTDFKHDDIFECQNLLKSIGISENGAVDYLSILKLPRHMQKKVMFRADKRKFASHGRINVEIAYQLTRVQDLDYKEFLFQKAVLGTPTKVIQALVDNHIDKVNKGEWKGIEASKSSIWKATKSDDRLLEISSDCHKLSAKLNSWKLTKLITLATIMTKEMFAGHLKDLRREIRLLDEAIVRRLKDRNYEKIKKFVPFEVQLNYNKKKHHFRYCLPVKILDKLGIERKKKVFLRLQIVEVKR